MPFGARSSDLSNETPFHRLTPQVMDNAKLREPQREAYAAISEHFSDPEKHREAGVGLPGGCGKSGLITLAPFAAQARKVLVIAPGLRISAQVLADFKPTIPGMIYMKIAILSGPHG